MEMKQLEIFVCVARNLNFSKAAEEMYISQPSVSAGISALEKAVSSQLLVRNTKGVSLTKTGIDFLAYAQKILALRDQAMHRLSGEDRSANGAVDIIASTIPAQHLLPGMIASFQQQWPHIAFRVEQADSHRVEQDMGGFRYDFGMAGTVPDAGRFHAFPVFDDELVLAVPKDAEQESDSIREHFAEYILHTPFIMRESGSGTRKEIETMLSKVGVDIRDLRVPAYFSYAHSILLAVSRGMGVSLVSKVAAKLYREAGLVRIVEMNAPLFRRRIFLLHNKELWLSPVQQAFASHARQYDHGVTMIL